MNSRPRLMVAAWLMAGALSTSAFADTPGNYWGVGLTGIDFTASNGEDISTNGGMLRAGREFFDFFAIELHFGIAKESQPNAFGDKFDLTHGAAFARFNLPYERFNFYLMAGSAQIDIDTGDTTADERFDAAGAGMDFFATGNTALTLEYTTYEEEEDASLDLIYIGFKHHFDFAGFR